MASVQVKQEPSEKEDVDVKNGNAGAGGADTEAGQQSEDNSNDGGQEDNAITLEQLIAENNRMLGLYEKMNARQTVLEEFIEVEYGERFDGFLKNRERLINVMGLGDGENSTEDNFDGSRSAKSYELVKLLQVVKEQAAANVSQSSNQQEDAGPSNRYQPYNSRGRGNQRPWNKNKRGGGGGGIGRY